MDRAAEKAKEYREQREGYIRQILADSPYLPESAMYQRCQTELRSLSTDVLMVLGLEVKKTKKAKGGE
jgi:hypothetical protein